MGSFANSLHVKSNDAEAVARTLTELLTDAGWRPTPKTVDERAPDSVRGVQISAPRESWVSLLDTDLMGAHSMVASLAKALRTHVIFFFVDDSDSWTYLLADPKGKLSEYESDEHGDEEDFGDGELVEATAAIKQLNELMRDGSMVQKFQDMQAQMLAAAPPEVREAHERMKTGQATPADMQRYQAWAMQELPKHQMQFRSMISGLFSLPGVARETRAKKKTTRKRSKAEQAAQKKRLDALRPLLVDGVSDERVQEVLEKRDIFAENVLSEFLPLLGISDFYANLSYRYLGGVKSSELAPHDIRFVHDLRFETSRPPQYSFS